MFFNCYYFPLFGLFATVGIYFPALKNEAGTIGKADTKNTLDNGEEDFTDHPR